MKAARVSQAVSLVLLGATLFIPLALIPADTAQAQSLSSATEEARDRMIKDAQAAHSAGDHKRALDLAQRAATIRLTPSLRYFLGFEQEEVGKLAEAYGNAQRCLRELELDPQAPARDEFLRLCTGLRDLLAPRIAYLTLKLPEDVSGAEVKVNGEAVNLALLGVPYVVTPGSVKIVASAPGRVPFANDITSTPGSHFEIKIALPASSLVAIPPASASESTPCPPGKVRKDGECTSTVIAESSGTASSQADRGSSGDASSGQSLRRWGLGLTIAGGGLLAASAGTWLVGDFKFRSLRDSCNKGTCTIDEATSGKESIRTFDRLSVGGAIASGVLLSAGSVLYVFAARKDDVERLDRLRLAIGLVGAGIAAVAAVYSIVAAGDKASDSNSTRSSGLTFDPAPSETGRFMLLMPPGRF